MKNVFMRILSLFGVLVICFSMLATPVYADTASDIGNNVGTFAEWLYRLDYPAESILDWFKSKFASGGDSSAYDTYVKSVDSALGSSTIGDNCVYLGNWSANPAQTYPSDLHFSSGSTYQYSGTGRGASYYECIAGFVAPVSGFYTFTMFCSGTSSVADAVKVYFDDICLKSAPSWGSLDRLNTCILEKSFFLLPIRIRALLSMI